MKLSPLASVVIPAHNAGLFLEATLDSVLQQTLADFELIVVDDGSTDSTPELLRKQSDSRLRVVRQPNQGPSAATNTGLGLARGVYVGFLDHDDLWEKTKLARHVAFLEDHPEVDLTFSWSRLVDESGRRLALHTRHWRGPLSFQQMLMDFVIGNTSAVVIRRLALDGAGWFDPELSHYYDMELFLRVALLRPNNVHAIPEELTFYRRHEGQMSRDWRRMARDWDRVLERMCAGAAQEVAAIQPQASANMCRYFACLAYEQQEFLEACRLLRQGLQHSPASFIADLRNWKAGAASLGALVLPSAIRRRLERLAGVRISKPATGGQTV